MTKYTEYFVMWQYSSKESVSGINGNVDMSNQYYDFYTAIGGKETYFNHVINISSDEVKPITKSELEKVIEVAKEEVGYLEKKSNSQLDDKTANAGSNNYTKYWRDIKNWCGANYQAQPWCAGFVTWVFTVALGQARAKELLKHYPYVYCPTMSGLFTLYTKPQVGDIVIFYRNGVFAHTGLVIAVNDEQFTTVEGNTSGASAIVDNGGGVCKKTYNLSSLKGTKFCRPAYSSTAITSDSNKVAVADDMHTVKWKGFVIADSLSVRLQPTTFAKTCSFSPLKKGTEVGISYEKDGWYLVKYDGKFGYVQKKYISDKKDDTIEKEDTKKTEQTEQKQTITDDIHTVKWIGIVNTKKDPLNVRMLPSYTGKTCSFSPLKKGAEVGVCHKSGDWYLIEVDGKYGYAYSSYIKKKE